MNLPASAVLTPPPQTLAEAGAATAPAEAATAISALKASAESADALLARVSAPLVRVRDLRVRYSENAPFVLDGVHLDLHPGETVALLGSSGSGKSTLMKTLTGFAPIASGEVRAAGFDVAKLRRGELRGLRSQVGQVFQQFNLVGRLSVLTNVLTGSLYQAGPVNTLGTFRNEDRRRALELLDRVGIAHKAKDEARSLSGGQQQRVAIARALMQRPKLILADEPVASLDPKMSRKVLKLLQSIARDEKIPVLISLHVLPLALAHSDRIVGLRHGEIVVEGKASDLDAEQLAPIYDIDDSGDDD